MSRIFVRGGVRSGVTLIELLVVVAIIGVLVALLLPAIQSAREAARRTSCNNNLHQLGAAINSYQASHGVFPPGYIGTWRPDLGVDVGPGWGWGAMLLPMLEQASLFQAINFEQNIETPNNATARVQPLSVFLCPSDSMPQPWMAAYLEMKYVNPYKHSLSVYPICSVAGANYVGVYGISEPGPAGEGVFFRNSRVRVADVSDGTSYTFAVGERAKALSDGRGLATWVGAVPGANLLSCGGSDPDSNSYCVQEDACGMVLGHTGEGHGPGDPAADVNQFLSMHARGSFFLFCDGHVAWMDGAMDYRTYKGLSTRAGGEPVPSDAY
jgi:prepilin-type N-terminal cleavage/methylation domain-containing protein/prepilin-type processing-associated H-X9-DG protein